MLPTLIVLLLVVVAVAAIVWVVRKGPPHVARPAAGAHLPDDAMPQPHQVSRDEARSLRIVVGDRVEPRVPHRAQ